MSNPEGLPPADAPLLYPTTAAPVATSTPAPRGRRSVAGPLTIAVAAMLILGGAAFLVLHERSGAPAPPAAADPTPAAPSFVPYEGDLADLVVPLPAGAREVELEGITPEMSDAQQAGTLLGLVGYEDAMVKNLNKLGLVDGKLVAWVQGDDLVVVDLLRFSRPVDAVSWFRTTKQGLSGARGIVNKGNLHDVGYTGFYGWFEASYEEDGSHALFGIYADGQFGVDVETTNKTATVNLDLLQQIAQEQYQRLPLCNCLVP